MSADAVRSIDSETTRYPVEFGRATGGVIALYTGMGDDKFRFNATNFVPSFRDLNGIRFDKFVPRFTFSGPLKRGARLVVRRRGRRVRQHLHRRAAGKRRYG